MFRRSRSVALLLLSCALSGSAARAVDRPDLLGRSDPTPRVVPLKASISNSPPSAEAVQVAQLIGIYDDLLAIQQMRAQGGAKTSVEYLERKQDTLEVIVMAGYEIDTVAARIDRELSNASEVLAYLAERRDRAVRINSYADFISGGITGIISGGLNLADAGGKAPDVLDTVEGVIQTSLASWALKQQRGEQKHERGTPSIIAHLFQTKAEAKGDYPPEVWAYLSAPVPASPTSASRLDLLVDRWRKLGVCFTHGHHRGETHDRIQKVANGGQMAAHERLTIDILEDRVAMLSDLRATIFQMNADLMELTQTLHGLRPIIADAPPQAPQTPPSAPIGQTTVTGQPINPATDSKSKPVQKTIPLTVPRAVSPTHPPLKPSLPQRRRKSEDTPQTQPETSNQDAAVRIGGRLEPKLAPVE